MWRDLIRRVANGPDRLCHVGRSLSVQEVYLCQTLETLENKTKKKKKMKCLFSPVRVPVHVHTSEESVWRTFVAFVRRLVRCLAQTFVKSRLCCAGQPSFVESTILSVYCDFPPLPSSSAVVFSHWCWINLFALSVDFVCRLYARALGFVQMPSCEYFFFLLVQLST